MSSGITSRPRKSLEWWREENEVPVTNRLTEAYDQSGFKPGWDGVVAKNSPAGVKGTGYAKQGDFKKDYDKLGPGEKTKKSADSFDQEVPSVKEKKVAPKKGKVQEAFGEDEFQDDQDFGGDDFGGDEMGGDDVPAEFDDMGDEGLGEGGADDITVEVDGVQYKLVPVEDEMGGEEGFGDEGDLGGDEFGGEDDLGGDFGDEDMGDEELGRHGGVKAESQDVTRESKKKGLKEAEVDVDSELDDAINESIAKLRAKKGVKPNKAQKEAATRKYIQMKNFAEKKLKELFTGEYVLNKQGEPGFDFSEVGGDDSFAVKSPARSGDQYSPTVSTSIYEPGADSKGGKTAHAKKVESTKTQFERWLEAQEKALNEAEDPGQTSDDFNKQDKGVETMDDWSDTPETIGSRPAKELLTTEQKARQNRANRRQESVNVPSAEVKEKLESKLDESFDFKTFIAGGYRS